MAVYELRTSGVRVGRIGEFEARVERMLPERERYGKLVGCWHTEIGPLPQVVELWHFEDFAALGEAASATFWSRGLPPESDDIVMSAQSDILMPAKWMRPVSGEPETRGPFYEMRSYVVRQGTLPPMLETWGEWVEEREKYGKKVGVWGTMLGNLDKIVHIDPYPDLNTRVLTRQKVIDLGIWPPSPPPEGNYIVTQEIKIMLPARFSPLQ
ncbi:MAG: NIPSNAP family protein [Chloroflexi bacterium]|nr:NIPSNAP family protein [Chloroflexota bacterium]